MGRKTFGNRLAVALGMVSMLGSGARGVVGAAGGDGAAPVVDHAAQESENVVPPSPAQSAKRAVILDSVRKNLDEQTGKIESLRHSLLNPEESWKWTDIEEYQRLVKNFDTLEGSVDALCVNLDAIDAALVSGAVGSEQVDDQIIKIERDVKGADAKIVNVTHAWERLEPRLQWLRDKKVSAETKKVDANNQMSKALISRASKNVLAVQESAHGLGPDLAREVRESCDAINAELDSLSRELTRGCTSIDKSRNLKLRAEALVTDVASVQKLVDRYSVEQTKRNLDQDVANLARKVDQQEKVIKQAINMNLDSRQMKAGLRKRLVSLQGELSNELLSMRNQVAGLESDAGVDAVRNVKAAVEDGCIRISKLLLNWKTILRDVEKDDRARAYWTPEGRRSAQHSELRELGEAVRKDLNMTLRDKTVRICQEIHRIQPGCGVKMRPIVQQLLSSGLPANTYDEEGNVNPNWFADRQFVLTGTGGTGKTSSIQLVAQAMGAKLLTVTAADLRDEVRNANVIKQIQLYTQGSTDRKLMILLDEVDAATCDQPGERKTAFDRLKGQIDAEAEGRGTGLEGRSPRSAARWKLSGGPNADAPAAARSIQGLRRNEAAFRGLSKIYEEIASHPSPNFAGIYSTMNRDLDDLPAEVARRVCKDPSRVIRMGLPSQENLAKVIDTSLPGLYFADGFSREEGIRKIAKIAYNKNWSAIQVLDTIGRIAEIGTTAADGECFLPCNMLCKYINGVASEDDLRAEIMKFDAARATRVSAADRLTSDTNTQSQKSTVSQNKSFAAPRSGEINWEQLIEG